MVGQPIKGRGFATEDDHPRQNPAYSRAFIFVQRHAGSRSSVGEHRTFNPGARSSNAGITS